QGRPAEPTRSRSCPVYRSHPRPMVRQPRDLARAGTATVVDRDRRTGRCDGELTPGRLPPRRTAPHRRAGAGPALREAAQLTTITPRQEHAAAAPARGQPTASLSYRMLMPG